MKRAFKKYGLIIVAMALIFTGCEKKDDPVVLTFSPDIVSVIEGSSATATILTGKEPFTVQSASEAIATASVDGKTITVTGVSEGNITINVTGGDGSSAKLAVSVAKRAATAPVLNATAVELEEGFTSTVTITGGTAPFTVSSSDSKIATATVSGTTVTVTGVDGGTALITVTGADNASATFAVM